MRQQCKKGHKISFWLALHFIKIIAAEEFQEKLITKINTSQIKCISSSKDRYKDILLPALKEKPT